MSVEHKSGKLSVGTKLGFGICDLGGNIYFTTIGFWLMFFLTDVVGLEAALAGYAIMIGRIIDAVTDPLMGYISDRTKSKIGRRRLYLLIGSVPMMLTMFFLFTNPGLSSQTALFVWASIAFSLVSIAFTIVNIPYSSLTPEMTTDFNERTSLNGYRMSFAAVGTLVAAGATLPLVSAFRNQSVGFSMMGLVFGALTMGATLVTFFSVREPASSQAVVSKKGLFRSYFEIFKNKPYLLILVPWICNMTGVTIVSSMLPYYFKYIYRSGDSVTLALLILIVTALIFISVWVKISKKIGKKLCYMIGMGLLGAVVVVFYLFGHRLPIQFAYVLMFFGGVGLSTGYVFPWAIVPDSIDYDYVKTGEKKEGVYYGMWTFASKLGQALAGLIVGLILSGTGYQKELSVNDIAVKPDTTVSFYADGAVRSVTAAGISKISDLADKVEDVVYFTPDGVVTSQVLPELSSLPIISTNKLATNLVVSGIEVKAGSVWTVYADGSASGITTGAAFQKPSAILGIRMLMGWIPAFFFLMISIVLIFYPITQSKYEEIRRQIDEMEKSKATSGA